MAKAKKTETLNLDTVLFKCRDILRQARNSGSFFAGIFCVRRATPVLFLKNGT